MTPASALGMKTPHEALCVPPRLCNEVAAQLQSTFELVALGLVKFLLGVEILVTAGRMQEAFCQRAYVQHIFKTFHMET
ncbi:hypothetical protein PybrP1_004991 [[Pythium] brassicae (nom. inval.)]|nr:hypothetical protein PybrP1_004991 [[Pythium] brassicae (nom. inval.)]